MRARTNAYIGVCAKKQMKKWAARADNIFIKKAKQMRPPTHVRAPTTAHVRTYSYTYVRICAHAQRGVCYTDSDIIPCILCPTCHVYALDSHNANCP